MRSLYLNTQSRVINLVAGVLPALRSLATIQFSGLLRHTLVNLLEGLQEGSKVNVLSD